MGGYWVGGSEGSLRGWHVGCKRGEAVGDEAREESRGQNTQGCVTYLEEFRLRLKCSPMAFNLSVTRSLEGERTARRLLQ